MAEVVVQLLGGHVSPRKQQAQCLRFLSKRDWRLGAVVPPGAADETVLLVKQGQASMVLMSHATDESREIKARILEAGGQVTYCREPREPDRHKSDLESTSGIVRALYLRGQKPPDIAAIMRISVARVMRALGIDGPERRR